jgi:hypothetical protein
MAATDMHTTVEELLEVVFSTWSMLRIYNEANCHYSRV